MYLFPVSLVLWIPLAIGSFVWSIHIARKIGDVEWWFLLMLGFLSALFGPLLPLTGEFTLWLDRRAEREPRIALRGYDKAPRP